MSLSSARSEHGNPVKEANKGKKLPKIGQFSTSTCSHLTSFHHTGLIFTLKLGLPKGYIVLKFQLPSCPGTLLKERTKEKNVPKLTIFALKQRQFAAAPAAAAASDAAL